MPEALAQALRDTVRVEERDRVAVTLVVEEGDVESVEVALRLAAAEVVAARVAARAALGISSADASARCSAELPGPHSTAENSDARCMGPSPPRKRKQQSRTIEKINERDACPPCIVKWEGKGLGKGLTGAAAEIQVLFVCGPKNWGSAYSNKIGSACRCKLSPCRTTRMIGTMRMRLTSGW